MAFVSVSLIVNACSANPQKNQESKVSTPPPSDEFVSVANNGNINASQEVALVQAQKFCKHWNAVPGIIKSETVDIFEENSLKEAAKDSVKNAVTTGKLFKKAQRYKTTLVYKCYQ